MPGTLILRIARLPHFTQIEEANPLWFYRARQPIIVIRNNVEPVVVKQCFYLPQHDIAQGKSPGRVRPILGDYTEGQN